MQTCDPLGGSISARAEKHKQVSELEITRGETLGNRQTSSTGSHAAIQECLWGGRDDVEKRKDTVCVDMHDSTPHRVMGQEIHRSKGEISLHICTFSIMQGLQKHITSNKMEPLENLIVFLNLSPGERQKESNPVPTIAITYLRTGTVAMWASLEEMKSQSYRAHWEGIRTNRSGGL